jgi:hypothetical protein
MKRVKEKYNVKTLALFVVSIVICIFLAEIVLRYLSPVNYSSSVKHRIPHPVLGWVLESGASYLNKMSEDTVRVTYNSKGWRDTEHDLDNKRGVFRILVLGDSFMEGYSVGLEDLFHKQIERLARKEGINIEIINMGVGGYGTLQEYLVFRDIGQYYKPDIVLLGFYTANDLRNNFLPLESPVSTSILKVKSRPFLDPSHPMTWKINQVDSEGTRRRYLSAKAKADSFTYKFATGSALIQTTLRAVEHIKQSTLFKNRASKIGTNSESEKETSRAFAQFGVHYCKEPPQFTKAWATTKRIFSRLKKDTSSIGGKVFVFSVPALYEVLEEKIKEIPNRERICWEDAPGNKRLKGVLEELEIEYVDLLPGFRKRMRSEGHNLFRHSDNHWDENGHHLAATIVYSVLKNRNLLTFVEEKRPVQKETAPGRN